ncbi:MAG: hypothetical protein AAF733_12640 [Verrucomicrobiota bacterium]
MDRLLVRVSPFHIEQMYERFDSGMCDLSTSNAIVLALKEVLGSGDTVKTIKMSRGEWGISIVELTLPLPHEANQWMQLLWDGFIAVPITFDLKVPKKSSLQPRRETKVFPGSGKASIVA